MAELIALIIAYVHPNVGATLALVFQTHPIAWFSVQDENFATENVSFFLMRVLYTSAGTENPFTW
jgi:hypothetical protein